MSSDSVVSMAVFVLCLAISVVGVGASSLAEDKQALMGFRAAASSRVRGLNWNPSTAVCGNWTGVTCAGDGSRVVAVRLQGIIGFGGGPVPPNTLGRLSALEILSLDSCGFAGPFPADFANLTALRALYLHLNNFSGPLPSDFSPWRSLREIDLSFNDFSGSIPDSISDLAELTTLNLSNNWFSGQIPDISLPNLNLLDLSNNHLSGTIPQSLLRFPNSSFFGNDLPSTNPFTSQLRPLPSPMVAPRRTSESAISGIIVGGSVLIFLMLALFIYLRCSVKEDDTFISGKGRLKTGSTEKAVIGDPEANNRLVFFEGCTFAFDLEDLLRASAEVLGKGTFGTTYKAVLEDSTTVVVKRLKDGVGKREFEQQMEVVGSIKHENVVELRAYYYSKEEKLIIYDYYRQGSVFSLIHGKRGQQRTTLDWETRLKIAHGAAKGIAHIHGENNGKLVHGNIKSSNIFLNGQRCGCVGDLGLPCLINPMVPPVSRTAGYRAPEALDTRKASQASDVYSFGVLMLELLTGKSSIHVRRGGEEMVHLVRWVQSVVREEWTAEVFDTGLMRRRPEVEDEMVEMLRIAMNCVVRSPELRPKMADVVRMVEGVRGNDSGNRSSTEAAASESSTPAPAPAPAQDADEAQLSSSHWPTDTRAVLVNVHL